MCEEDYDVFTCPSCHEPFQGSKFVFLGSLTKDTCKPITCPRCSTVFICERTAQIIYKYNTRIE
jgi:hypothetical protein